LLPKEGYTLFHIDGNTGVITPSLDDYAIIPVDE
jgi:hypothetical protein